MTLVGVSRTVGVALDAAKQLQEEYGVNAEVINLRSLRPLDREAIIQSVSKTHYLVTVEGGWPQYGVGSEVAASIVESKYREIDWTIKIFDSTIVLAFIHVLILCCVVVNLTVYVYIPLELRYVHFRAYLILD